MLKQKPPVPLPRRLPPQAKSVDQELLKCGSSPQSPTDCSEVDKLSIKHEFKAQPPPLPLKPPKRQLSETTEIQNAISFSDLYEAMESWTDVCRDLKLKGEEEAVVINIKAELLYKAIQEYKKQMCEHGGTLKTLINEFKDIALNLDKVSRGTKIAGITGGASTVAGGVAAAAGVILCPFTAGASLALTAVGVGVAAAGGVTGASAAIAHKANLTQDRKKIDKTMQEFDGYYGNVINCLRYINEGMELLKEHGLSVLSTTLKYSIKAAKVVKLATGDASAMSSENSSKAYGFMKGFAVAMDFYFIEGKEGAKVKKGLESKLAKKLLRLTEDLDEGLNELMKIKEVFEKLD